MFLLLGIVFFGWRIIGGPVNAGIQALIRLASLIA